MLISLIVWTYLSILCLIWGHLFLWITRAIGVDTPPLHPALLCFTGLAVISTVALGLSILAPLDWKSHALLILGAILHLLQKQKRDGIQRTLATLFRNYSPLQFGLLAICILMVLVVSLYPITHPDTLNYHARTILLFQRYGSVPGIVDLQRELGFQSAWFAALAITNPGTSYHLIFLNGAVLCWFFIYVISTWNYTWVGWLLLSYSLYSWIQVRLTAASASPDFIASLYGWTAVHSWLKKDDEPAGSRLRATLVILCCLTAVLIKLSMLVYLFLAFMAWLDSRKGSVRILIYAASAILILFVKNAIASGYILYPSSTPDILHLAWKMPVDRMKELQHYISAYAVIPFAGDSPPQHLSWSGKVAAWWSYIEAPERLLLLGILTGVIFQMILLFRKGRSSPLFRINTHTKALMVTFAGSLVWLLNAPSPRFGTGFLVPLLYLLFYLLPQPVAKPTRLLNLVAGYCLLIIVSAYTVYRCIYFPVTSHLLTPAGIDPSGYAPIEYNGLKVDLLHDRITTPDGLLTGQSIRQGFTAQ